MQLFSLINLFSAGVNAKGQEVFLKDIWPTRDEIQAVERQYVIPGMFKEVYQKIEVGPARSALTGPGNSHPFVASLQTPRPMATDTKESHVSFFR